MRSLKGQHMPRKPGWAVVVLHVEMMDCTPEDNCAHSKQIVRSQSSHALGRKAHTLMICNGLHARYESACSCCRQHILLDVCLLWSNGYAQPSTSLKGAGKFMRLARSFHSYKSKLSERETLFRKYSFSSCSHGASLVASVRCVSVKCEGEETSTSVGFVAACHYLVGTDATKTCIACMTCGLGFRRQSVVFAWVGRFV